LKKEEEGEGTRIHRCRKLISRGKGKRKKNKNIRSDKNRKGEKKVETKSKRKLQRGKNGELASVFTIGNKGRKRMNATRNR